LTPGPPRPQDPVAAQDGYKPDVVVSRHVIITDTALPRRGGADNSDAAFGSICCSARTRQRWRVLSGLRLRHRGRPGDHRRCRAPPDSSSPGRCARPVTVGFTPRLLHRESNPTASPAKTPPAKRPARPGSVTCRERAHPPSPPAFVTFGAGCRGCPPAGALHYPQDWARVDLAPTRRDHPRPATAAPGTPEFQTVYRQPAPCVERSLSWLVLRGEPAAGSSRTEPTISGCPPRRPGSTCAPLGSG